MINEEKDIKQELKVKELGIFELRGLAREIGIPSPTTRKREELISLILEKFKSGIALDTQGKRKGRPFKKLASIDDIVNSMTTDKPSKDQVLTFENIMTFAQEMPTFLTEQNEEESVELEAIVRKDKDRFKANDGERWIFFKEDDENYKKLRQGDKVLVEATSMGQSNQYNANQILKINDVYAKDYIPKEYHSSKIVLSKEKLEIANITLAVGKRNAVMLKQDLYENDNFEKMVEFCQNNKIKMVVLGVNTSFEDQLLFENLDFENFTTKYGTDDSVNFNMIINAITHVDNLISNGENVLFCVLDIMEIIRLADRCFVYKEEKAQHAKNTMTILYKIMELGVAYQDGHNSTLLIGYNELDKDDASLKSEVLRISNIIE